MTQKIADFFDTDNVVEVANELARGDAEFRIEAIINGLKGFVSVTVLNDEYRVDAHWCEDPRDGLKHRNGEFADSLEEAWNQFNSQGVTVE